MTKRILQLVSGVILACMLVAGSAGLFVPQAQAQAILPCGQPGADPNNCTTPGGVTLTRESVVSAINAPTPNLANTTAYVLYTIAILTTGTFDVGALAGTASAPTSTYHASYPDDVSVALNEGGALGGVAYLIAELYVNKPASAQTYVADLIQNSRFTGDTAYAQGIGFGALNPILGTWKAFRDVAYYLLTIMFLITGFLILIRHKISGNVAVTVQNALPKLVITLILITFSYAIAGLIVDLMFLVLYFVVNLFSGRIFLPDANFSLLFGAANKSLSDLVFDTHIFEFTIGYIFNSGDASAWNAAQSVGFIIYDAIQTVPLFDAIVGEGTIFSGLFQGILNIVFTIIFGIALLIAMFRTFFALIMSYAGFVINVVLSPFILLAGAIPGQDPWKNWIKNLIAGLAPFVVAIFMILMAMALTGGDSINRPGIGYSREAQDQSGLRLPLILSSSVDVGAFVGILSMGFMLLLPEAVKITKNILQVKGGPLDQFKDSAVSNFQKGWTGDKQFGFIPSGKSVAGGALAGGALGTAAGAVGGAYAGYKLGGNVPQGRGQSLARAGGALGGALGGSYVGGLAGTTLGGALPFAKEIVYKPGKAAVTRIQKGYEQVNAVATTARDVRDMRQAQGSVAATAQNTGSSDRATPEGQPTVSNPPGAPGI